jgi:hypothetical protein
MDPRTIASWVITSYLMVKNERERIYLISTRQRHYFFRICFLQKAFLYSFTKKYKNKKLKEIGGEKKLTKVTKTHKR